MVDEIFKLLTGIGFIPLIILFLKTYPKDKKNRTYINFCIYLIIIGLINTIVYAYGLLEKPNLFISHFYFIIEFILLSLFFRELLSLSQRKLVNALIGVTSISLATMLILTVLGYYELKPLDLFEIIICALPILIFSVMHLYDSMSTSLRFIYVTVAILFYKAVSVVIFMLLNYANSNEYVDGFSGLLWSMNRVFLLIYFCFIFIEWFKNYRVKKSS